ncbi:MAG: hypothetical protein QNJ47_13990 [Nostocaceae cyanobacterium]|nr:hypothetical protein [Nostocaceae cyanobacterium]
MPRLVGNKSNVAISTGVAVVLLVVIGLLVEYFGVIDLVPNFGRKTRSAIEEVHLVSKS